MSEISDLFMKIATKPTIPLDENEDHGAPALMSVPVVEKPVRKPKIQVPVVEIPIVSVQESSDSISDIMRNIVKESPVSGQDHPEASKPVDLQPELINILAENMFGRAGPPDPARQMTEAKSFHVINVKTKERVHVAPTHDTAKRHAHRKDTEFGRVTHVVVPVEEGNHALARAKSIAKMRKHSPLFNKALSHDGTTNEPDKKDEPVKKNDTVKEIFEFGHDTEHQKKIGYHAGLSGSNRSSGWSDKHQPKLHAAWSAGYNQGTIDRKKGNKSPLTKEEIEALTELTNGTLTNYRGKAQRKYNAAHSNINYSAGTSDERSKDKATMKKRSAGFKLAAKKIKGTAKINATEEYDMINEKDYEPDSDNKGRKDRAKRFMQKNKAKDKKSKDRDDVDESALFSAEEIAALGQIDELSNKKMLQYTAKSAYSKKDRTKGIDKATKKISPTDEAELNEKDYDPEADNKGRSDRAKRFAQKKDKSKKKDNTDESIVSESYDPMSNLVNFITKSAINESRIVSASINEEVVLGMRKSVSLRENYTMGFNDGSKINIPLAQAKKALNRFDSLSTEAEKAEYTKKLAHSLDSFRANI